MVSRPSGHGQRTELWGGYPQESYFDRSFYVMCPASPIWRDVLDWRVSEMAARGSDGIWVDQLAGANPYLCYESSHGHADPATAWSHNRDLAATLREAIGEDAIFTCEGALDALGDSVDIFGTLWFLPMGYSSTDAPQVLRYTLPTKLIGLKDEGGLYGTPTFHATAFLLGCPILDDNPGSLRFLRIYDSAPQCFYYGRFMDDVGLTVSPASLRAKIHVADDEKSIAVAVWNPSAARTGTVTLDLNALGHPKTVQEVRSLPGQILGNFQQAGSVVSYMDSSPRQREVHT